jgi:hypothetical protein
MGVAIECPFGDQAMYINLILAIENIQLHGGGLVQLILLGDVANNQMDIDKRSVPIHYKHFQINFCIMAQIRADSTLIQMTMPFQCLMISLKLVKNLISFHPC